MTHNLFFSASDAQMQCFYFQRQYVVEEVPGVHSLYDRVRTQQYWVYQDSVPSHEERVHITTTTQQQRGEGTPTTTMQQQRDRIPTSTQQQWDRILYPFTKRGYTHYYYVVVAGPDSVPSHEERVHVTTTTNVYTLTKRVYSQQRYRIHV